MTEKKKPKFLRRRWYSYGKLGKRRKKKQVWRRPSGRDNKMRDKRRGYLASVSIGYRTDKDFRGKIKEKTPIMVYNMKELLLVKKDQIAIFANVGAKKRIELSKVAEEKKIDVSNVNTKKLVKRLEKKKISTTKENKK
jgi:ribosomal protein L32E